MANCAKLLEKAKESSANFRFSDALKLAECFGWEFRNQTGSHLNYKHPNAKSGALLTFASHDGKLPRFMLSKLLGAIDLLEKNQ